MSTVASERAGPGGLGSRARLALADPARASRLAYRVGLASALVIAACTLALLADHLVAAVRAPAEKSRVEELQEQALSDPETAALLHDERERQTNRSLARDTRARVLAWILLVSGVVFVGSGKLYMSLRPQPLPELEALVADRFPLSTPGTGARQAPPPAPAEPEPIDLAFVDDLVARVGTGRDKAIPLLQAIQAHYRYLPDEALRRLCERTDVTPAQVAGTSSFYAQFRRSPVGRHVVRICHGTACHVAGAEQISAELRRHLEIPADADTDPRRLFTLDDVACLGCCSLAPVMMIEEETAGRLSPASARAVLDALAPRS